jgi:hypothetical protein
MTETSYSMLIGTAGLSVAALIALSLTLLRKPTRSDPPARRRLVQYATVALGAQCVHFTEEWATGFHEQYPLLLLLRPWSLSFFVTFNVAWIVIWSVSLIGLRADFRAAFFPIWFLGLGCVVNVLAHPYFSFSVGGYFPGLWTSPIVGIAGALLMRELVRSTSASSESPDAR